MQTKTRHTEIQRVLVITLIANILVAAGKLVIGLITHSLAMIADGVHSSLDATSNIIGLVSNALAARPADEEHPYGHRRFETLASLIIGGALLVTGWEILQGSISRLSGEGVPEIGPVNFVVMIVTIGINLGVTVYERGAGKRLKSELLLADAEHTRSDVLVSLTVLASLTGVELGWQWMDAAAAIVVVGLIGLVAWRIMRRAADILVDRAALNPSDVAGVVESVAGIEQVARVRSRGPEDAVQIDLDVRVAGPTTAQHSDAIAKEVRNRLRQQFEGLTDIQINFVPMKYTPNDLALQVRAEADALGLGAHEIIPTTGNNGLVLELHVEVSPEQSVGEAHAIVSEFEERLMEVIPNLDRVVTHIEPAPLLEAAPENSSEAHAIARRALALAVQSYPNSGWHDISIRQEPDYGYALSMHCYVASDMRLEDAHHIAEEVETNIRALLPIVHRVTIHTEPDNSG
jgi:cation diffusion facilitator family transporter